MPIQWAVGGMQIAEFPTSLHPRIFQTHKCCLAGRSQQSDSDRDLGMAAKIINIGQIASTTAVCHVSAACKNHVLAVGKFRLHAIEPVADF